MSKRQTHVRVGFAGTAVVLLGIAVAGLQDPSLPVLAGASQAYHLVVGIGLALACGWVGARLPDWIESARTPHHRGFWHSKTLAVALLVVSTLLTTGHLLDRARPAVFFVRIAALFVTVGYLTHLALDLLSAYGLPRFRKAGSMIEGQGFTSFLVKLFAGVGLSILALGVVRTFWMFGEELVAREMVWKPLLLGTGVGATFDHFVLRKRMSGLHTFVHEAAHAVVALLAGHKVVRFVSTRSAGGFVEHQGRSTGTVANVLIALAPYFWPTLTVVSVLMRPLVSPAYFPWYDLWVGATVGFHVVTSLRDLKVNSHGNIIRRTMTGEPAQTDIAKSGGLLVSVVYIVFAALVVYSLLVAVITDDYMGAVRWGEELGRQVWMTTRILGEEIPDIFRVLVA